MESNESLRIKLEEGGIWKKDIEESGGHFTVFAKKGAEVLVYNDWISPQYILVDAEDEEDGFIHLYKENSCDILLTTDMGLGLEKNKYGFYFLENVVNFESEVGVVIDHGEDAGQELLLFNTGLWRSPEGETRFSKGYIYKNTFVYTSLIDGLTRWFDFDLKELWMCPGKNTQFKHLSLITCSCGNFRGVNLVPEHSDTKKMLYEDDWVSHPSGKTSFEPFAPQGACRFVVLYDESNPDFAGIYSYETKSWMTSPDNQTWFYAKRGEIGLHENFPYGFTVTTYADGTAVDFNFKTGMWSESRKGDIGFSNIAQLNFETGRWDPVR